MSVMKLEKAPDETYADIGGLDQQIQEIKVCAFLGQFQIMYICVFYLDAVATNF